MADLRILGNAVRPAGAKSKKHLLTSGSANRSAGGSAPTATRGSGGPCGKLLGPQEEHLPTSRGSRTAG